MALNLAIETPPQKTCLGIAYRWQLMPVGFAHYDVVLCVATCRSRLTTPLNRGALDELRPSEVPCRTYHASLPPTHIAIELTDVSGTLGLLWPASDRVAEAKASAFERLVADAIIWEITHESITHGMPDVVLLQGPLLPKLRGRLLYRTIPHEHVIYTVTYQPEWLARLETPTANAQGGDQDDDAIRPRLSELYPPREVDMATRAWSIRAGGLRFHAEIVANTLDGTEASDWLIQRQSELEIMFSVPFAVDVEHGHSALPAPLAWAMESASSMGERQANFAVFLSAAGRPGLGGKRASLVREILQKILPDQECDELIASAASSGDAPINMAGDRMARMHRGFVDKYAEIAAPAKRLARLEE